MADIICEQTLMILEGWTMVVTNVLLVVKTKANAAAEVDKVCAGAVRVGPVKGL